MRQLRHHRILLAACLWLAGAGLAAAAATPTTVTFDGAAIAVDGPGAVVDGTTLRVTSGGSYRLRGDLEGGEVIVDAGKADVELVLDGVRIVSHRSAAVHVVAAGTTTITLAPGSENHLADAAAYERADPDADEPSAAVFAKDDLVIGGSGTLSVVGSYRNGIQGKDDVRIEGGTITVEAVRHGIKGKDALIVAAGDITVRAGADGLQASNADDPERGFVRIEGGRIAIEAGDDGIEAETSVRILDGTVAIVAGGGHTAGVTTAKGIKGLSEVRIDGGTITVDAGDDAIHTHGALVVHGGRLTLAAGDDAMHADGTLEIHGGDIDITACYEGLEAESITIFDGTIRIVARDDGVNAVTPGGATARGFGFAPGAAPDAVPGGATGLAPGDATGGVPGAMGARPAARAPGAVPGGGFGGGMPVGDAWLRIHGGTLVIVADGDGIDANGSIEMTGGVVIIHGPTVRMEAAIDYDRTFALTGGLLVAAGSAGMAQAPTPALSTQPTLAMTFSATVAGGVPLMLAREDGAEILTFVPARPFQSLVVSSPEFGVGDTVVVTGGGVPTVAPAADGRIAGGALQGATEIARVKLTDVVTFLGSGGGATRR